MVGTSLSTEERLAVVTASARSRPALTCTLTAATVSNISEVRPLMRSGCASVLPL
jgi:hypothetical protein